MHLEKKNLKVIKRDYPSYCMQFWLCTELHAWLMPEATKLPNLLTGRKKTSQKQSPVGWPTTGLVADLSSWSFIYIYLPQQLFGSPLPSYYGQCHKLCALSERGQVHSCTALGNGDVHLAESVTGGSLPLLDAFWLVFSVAVWSRRLLDKAIPQWEDTTKKWGCFVLVQVCCCE